MKNTSFFLRFISTVCACLLLTTSILATNPFIIPPTQAASGVIELIAGENKGKYKYEANMDNPDYLYDPYPLQYTDWALPGNDLKISIGFGGLVVSPKGNLYFAKRPGGGDNTILKFDTQTGLISSVFQTDEIFNNRDLYEELADSRKLAGYTAAETWPELIHRLDFDTAGNLYYTGVERRSSPTQYLRKIDATTGIVSDLMTEQTFTGYIPTGIGMVTSTLFDFQADGQGNFYFCSAQGEYNWEYKVLKLNSQTKTFSTIAGGGNLTLMGDVGDADVKDPASSEIIGGGSGGLATNVFLKRCTDLELTPDNKTLYIVVGGAYISKVDLQTGIITAVTRPFGGYSKTQEGIPALEADVNPQNIALDPAGNIYFINAHNGPFATIRKININTGIISRIAGVNIDPAFAEGATKGARARALEWKEGINMAAMEAYLSGGGYRIAINKNGTLFFTYGSTKMSKMYKIEGIGSITSGTQAPPPAEEGEPGLFNDVPSTHPNRDAIKYVKDKGIVGGYEDGTYKPDAPINRAELTKVVVEAKYAGQASGSNCFSDVTDDWSAPYICFAKLKEIIGGYPDGSFVGWNNVTFVEAIKIILNAFGIEVEGGADLWFENHVKKAAELGIIPTSISKFTQEVTRGEVAEIIHRLLEAITDKPSQSYNDLRF